MANFPIFTNFFLHFFFVLLHLLSNLSKPHPVSLVHSITYIDCIKCASRDLQSGEKYKTKIIWQNTVMSAITQDYLKCYGNTEIVQIGSVGEGQSDLVHREGNLRDRSQRKWLENTEHTL